MSCPLRSPILANDWLVGNMDDVIACSATWEAHLKLLEDVFRALQTAGLTLKPSKVHFGPKKVQYLGHVLSAFLAQKEDNGELDITTYFNKRFTSSQQHYSAAQKEYLAAVLAVTHWRPYIWGRHFVCVTDHSALRYLYSMQDTSSMLTLWAIALQSSDFTVEHKPWKLNVIPDTLSRLFNFENSEMRVLPHLAPICRNVSDNPALHGPLRLRRYQVNSHNLDET